MNDNKLTDPTPFIEIFELGSVMQLHLSGNAFGEGAVAKIIFAAGNARTQNGSFAYPWEGMPLWLRLERQFGKSGGRIPDAAADALVKIGRPLRKSVCLFGGAKTKSCSPEYCACMTSPPAMHLPYLEPPLRKRSSAVARGVISVQPPGAKPKQPGPVPAPWKKSKEQPAQPPALANDEDFPPLPGKQLPTEKTAADPLDDAPLLPPGLFEAPPPLFSLPYKIVPADASDDPCLTKGVVDIMNYYEPITMSCCDEWRASRDDL